MAAEPKTLQDAIIYFADADNCLNYLAARRWPNGVTCPHCGSADVGFVKSLAVRQIVGKRLTWAEVTGKVGEKQTVN